MYMKFKIIARFKQSVSFIFLISCFSFSLGTGFSQREVFFVEFQRQAPLDSLYAVFRKKGWTSDARARLTLRHLLAAHEASRDLALELAAVSESALVEHFWIVNGVALKGDRSRILKLQGREGVARIYEPEELAFFAILPKEPPVPAPDKSVGGTEPGLEAIGVRALWNMGYTGRGRLVLSFDTGVWPQHPAIQRGFLGRYRPYHQAWKSYHGVEEPADKSSSHGTHTVGTMTGLDPTQADTIGVAFNAYYMAVDPIVVNLADTLPFVQLMAAQQWALNPDGDTSTTHDIPDVICNSWGRPPGGLEASFCGGGPALALQALELAGIASEYSAGNDGPDSATASAPAYIPLSPVNAFSVGAVNANTPGFPIASFSSRGPTPCPAPGSLNIKPEVVAPGVNVRSCVGQNGYAFYSGTSMAGPHVAGALLLLKEAFPYLPGEILKEALYYTAVDLGPIGEENVYGNGLINVEAAFQWLVGQGHVPVPPDSQPDLMISAVDYPAQSLLCAPLDQLQIQITNRGPVAFSGLLSVQVGLVQNAASFQNLDLGSVNLSPGQSQSLTLPVTLMPSPGKNELWIRLLPQDSTLHEPDIINNERNVRFWFAPSAPFPFTEQFEDSTLTALNWYVVNPDLNKTWTLASTGGQVFGNTSARMNFYGYAPQNQKDMLISPWISMPASGPVHLFFDYAYKFVNSSKRDSLLIKVSTDCGINFQTVAAFPGDSLNTVPSGFSGNFTPSEPGHWRTRAVNLSAFAMGQPILIAFYTSNRGGANLYIDNVHVTASGVSIPQNTSISDFSLWPNPAARDIFANTGEPGNLRIFSMDGLLRASFFLLEGLHSVQLPDLASGMYLAVWEGKTARKSFKLIVRP